MRFAREPACADREADAPERWSERVCAGLAGREPAACMRRPVPSLSAAIVILSRPEAKMAASERPQLSVLTASDERSGSCHFPVIRPEGISAGQTRARLARGWPLTAGPLPLWSPEAGRGRAGCPNTATPEHIPSAIPSYGAGRGFGKAADRRRAGKFLISRFMRRRRCPLGGGERSDPQGCG